MTYRTANSWQNNDWCVVKASDARNKWNCPWKQPNSINMTAMYNDQKFHKVFHFLSQTPTSYDTLALIRHPTLHLNKHQPARFHTVITYIVRDLINITFENIWTSLMGTLIHLTVSINMAGYNGDAWLICKFHTLDEMQWLHSITHIMLSSSSSSSPLLLMELQIT